MARALEAFLEALGLRGAAMIGNSMGGYVAMLLALEDPDAIGKLVNVHSPAIPLRRLRLLNVALRSPLARLGLGAVVARTPERFAHRNVHYRDESLKSLEEARIYGAPLATREGRAAFASWLGDGLDPRDLRAFCARLVARRDRGESFPVPLRLVYSREDPMVPPSVGEALHRLVPDASMIWLERSSHFAHVDTPERFLESVADFL